MASGDDEAECPACGRQVYQAEAYLAGKVYSKPNTWSFQNGMIFQTKLHNMTLK